MSKRFYGLLSHQWLSHRTLLKGLYAIAQRQVAAEAPETLVVAIDPVNAREAVHPATGRGLDGSEKHATSSGW